MVYMENHNFMKLQCELRRDISNPKLYLLFLTHDSMALAFKFQKEASDPCSVTYYLYEGN